MSKVTSLVQTAVANTIKQYERADIIIAYSGGVDSQVLLHSVSQLKKQQQISHEVTVCHVNHGLSRNALDWQSFAQKECEKFSLKLVIKQVKVRAHAQQSLEEVARELRYSALKTVSDKPAIVLTGHHSDDQSETFLLALKRGAGLKGLSSMAKTSSLGKHLLIRPLLNISREKIEQYALANQLSWVEDESNQDTSFDRNFIRKKVMPLLKERWPSISNTINRSASHCFAGQELLDELAVQDLNVTKTDDFALNIERLMQLSPARFNNLIRFFLAQHNCLMPSVEQIAQVRLQLQADVDKTPMIKVANHYLRRYKHSLYLTGDYKDISQWQAEIDLTEQNLRLSLPDKLTEIVFSCQAINSVKADKVEQIKWHRCVCLPEKGQKVMVRFSHENPSCLPDYRQHSRSVKKVLQELNIPPWERKRIPFLYYDDELVAAIGYFVCQGFIVKDNQASILINWCK
ncbi:tRNA lysidine(34) synthetase TilS [Colwelliaceae bacterium MEBiC 14330]